MRRSARVQWTCCLIIMVMLSGIFQPIGMNAAQANDHVEGGILSDHFDEQATGVQPDGWEIPAVPAAVAPAPEPYILKATVEELESYAGKLLKFEKNAKTVSSYSIKRPVTTESSKVVMTYKVRAEQTNAAVYLPSLQNGSTVKFALISGKFNYMKENESSWTAIQTYQIGEWYNVKIMLDAEAGMFDFYINDMLLLSEEPGGQGTPLTSFYLGMYKDSIGTVYFDDIDVYAYNGQGVREVGDVLAETFDADVTGQAPPNWSLPSKPAAVEPAPNPYILQATVEEVPAYSGKVLKLEKNARSVASYSINHAVSTSSTKIAMTYKVRAEQNDAVIYLPSLLNGSSVKFAFNGGQFTYMKDGTTGWTNIQPYVSGEWYEVKIMLDADAGEFDFYIDGQLKLSREPGGLGGPVSSFYLGVYKDSIGTVYFDDFNIYSYKAATSVSFSEEIYDLAKDASLQLSLRFDPIDATVQSAIWSSSDPTVAEVSASGVVTGLSAGTTIITATPLEAVEAVSATVNIFAIPITDIHVKPVTSAVPEGSRQFLDAEVLPVENTDQRIVWGSEDPTIATVDRYGELTAIHSGTTIVYAATSDGSIRGETTVTVVARNVQHEIYVAPNGNDSNEGTEQAPFRTITRAQAQVREWNDQMSGDIIVRLREGTYTLEGSLEWNQTDSGRNGYYVRYESYPGEQAIVSGGKSITGWVEHDTVNTIFKANVGTDLQTRQLFVNGVRAIRARSESGLTLPVQTETGYISDDAMLANWSHISDLEFVYNERWTNPRVGVESIIVTEGKAHITMENPGWTAATNKGMTSASVPVYYENAYELLDEPGEWYYNSMEGVVYYKPRAWEDITTAEVIAPVLERMMTIRGASTNDPVRNIEFNNLVFMYTTWMRPSTSFGHSDAQNNHLRYAGTPDELPDSAIRVELANSVNFVGNEFSKLGVTAIRMENGVQNSLIEGNRFYDISGGALNIGAPDSNIRDIFNPDDHRLIMKNNDVLNNVIHDIGVDYKSASAVSAGYPVDMDISHNEMYALPYSGTHVGYGWGKDFDPVTKNVRIENNLIYDLMGMGLRDGGAVYSLGTTGATPEDKNTVSGNYIRNQMDEGAPLYTDEGSAYWKFEHNVIDLKDTTEWHSSKRWAQIWAASIHDVDFVNNFTTEAHQINNGYDNLFENNQVYPDANWPSEALTIINNAGIQPTYADIVVGEVSRWSIEALSLSEGGSAQANVYGHNGKDQPLTMATSEVYYSTEDASIAVVDDQGLVTGLSQGTTKLTAYIVNETMLRTLVTDIFVGDELTEVRLDDTAGNVAFIREGDSQQLHAYGNTTFGNRVELEDVAYTSSNPSMASVSEEGFVTAHQTGDVVLTLRGEFLGSSSVSYYLLRVNGSDTVHPYALQSEINDISSWYVNPTASNNVQADEESITIGTPSGGHAVYQGRKFASELIDFDMQVNGAGSWYAIMLGKQSETANYVNDDNYIVVLSASAIELHRYNQSKRTVIFGNLDGYTSLGGDAIPNTMLPFNSKHRVQLGTFQETSGVRIVMKVDGETVFDYVDTAPDAIHGPGYLGLIARSGSITLSKPEQQSTVAALVLEGPVGIQAGESQATVTKAVYDSGLAVVMLPNQLSYSSTEPSVATIDEFGIVHAHSTGSTVISATYGTVSSTLLLNIDSVAPLSWGTDAQLVAEVLNPTRVVLSWAPVINEEEVAEYRIYQRVQGDEAYTEVRFASQEEWERDGDIYSYVLKGLHPKKSYSFKVEAVDSLGHITSTGPSVVIEQRVSIKQ